LISLVSETPSHSRGKLATRRAMLSRRDALTAEQRAEFAVAIAERVDGLLAERRPAVLAMYAAKGSEVATAAIDGAARARGVRVAYPRIVGAERRLAFHEVRLEEMALGHFAIAEPREEAPVVELHEIGAFLVPGVAFDRASGARLGWGRGHYDATLSAAPQALRIGLAFDIQLIDGIAHEPHDVAMNMIVTEVATYVVA
jgi:5-formyltetrahydrofolate cyclo-ligase